MSILVAYYSRTGRTGQVAQAIAKEYLAEIEPITDAQSREGAYGYLRSGHEALTGRAGAIRPPKLDAGEFDLVIIGTPVWAGAMSSPVRAYLQTRRGRLGRVAFFCTQGGTGGEKAFKQMANLCACTPVASQIFTEHDVETGDYRDKVQQFKKAIAADSAATLVE